MHGSRVGQYCQQNIEHFRLSRRLLLVDKFDKICFSYDSFIQKVVILVA